MRIAGIGTLALCAAATTYAAEKTPKCFADAFEGHCVAAEVNGQKTVRMTKPTRKQLKPFEGNRSRPWGNCAAHYEVPSPVHGALALRFAWVPEAVGYFGGPRTESSVHVYPLEGQSLETRPEIASAPSVRAGGSAVMTRADVIESDQLPPGKYVLTARVSGARSWDCHGFFVQVAEPSRQDERR